VTRREIWDVKGDIVQVLHTHDVDRPDDVTLETVQDVEPVLDEVLALREAGGKTAGGMAHVARIPMIIYERALREGWADDDAAWARFLNDPDNAAFRVWGGHL
jgi:hypothetical protein